jgi:hypothetical protein
MVPEYDMWLGWYIIHPVIEFMGWHYCIIREMEYASSEETAIEPVSQKVPDKCQEC